MARILAPGAGAAAAASTSFGPSWLFGLCVFVVSVWVVAFAVFLCGRSDDERPKKKKPAPEAPVKKPAPEPSAKASRGSETVVDMTGMYMAAAFAGGAAYGGCDNGGHHGGHHGGCGGGHHGGGGCGGHGGGGCGGGCGGGGCGGC